MKPIHFALAALLMSTTASYAADAWKEAEVGGAKMWAYDGKPLYTFIKDKKAGDVTGDGVGDVWHIAKAD